MKLLEFVKYSSLSKEKSAFCFNIEKKSLNIHLNNIFQRELKIRITLNEHKSEFYNYYSFNNYFDTLNDLLDFYINESISYLKEYLLNNINNKNFLVKFFNKKSTNNLKKDIEYKISCLKTLLLKDKIENMRNRKSFFDNVFEPFFSHDYILNSLSNTSICLTVLKPLNINDNVFLFDFEEQKLIKTTVLDQNLSERGVLFRKDLKNIFTISNYYNYVLIDSENVKYSLCLNSDKEKYDIDSKHKYLVFYSEKDFSEYKDKLFNKEKDLVIF